MEFVVRKLLEELDTSNLFILNNLSLIIHGVTFSKEDTFVICELYEQPRKLFEYVKINRFQFPLRMRVMVRCAK